MWDFWLDFVLRGWFILLIIVLARKWAVILTDCKWVVVNSIRIQKWVVHYYKSQMGYMFAESIGNSTTHGEHREKSAQTSTRSQDRTPSLSMSF